MLLISNIIISALASLLLLLLSVILIIIDLEGRNLLSEVSDQSLANSIPLLSKRDKR